MESSKAVGVATSPRGAVATSPHEVGEEVVTLHHEGEVEPVESLCPEDVASQEDVVDLPHGVVGTSRHVVVVTSLRGVVVTSRHEAVAISHHGAVGTSHHGAVETSHHVAGGTLLLGDEAISMPLMVEALRVDRPAVTCLEDHRCGEDRQ